ncbi:hypothetical protein DRO97_10155 [Archaeoglobales archaeon]|nr:MAG: hypothetical protein DRO97_10155 [Archaeoglobales archaeon]
MSEFNPYSTHDFLIANHIQYPRCTMVFHQTPHKYKSGKLRFNWTHPPKFFKQSNNYKAQQYAKECMKTLRCIPDYHVFSASQYAKVNNISHVTAKKRLLSDSNIIQISKKYFVKCNGEIARQFILNIIYKYNNTTTSAVRTNKLTLPTILKRLQELKEYALTHDYAFYPNIAKVLTQPILSWLIRVKVMQRLQLDFIRKRSSVVYLCCN